MCVMLMLMMIVMKVDCWLSFEIDKESTKQTIITNIIIVINITVSVSVSICAWFSEVQLDDYKIDRRNLFPFRFFCLSPCSPDLASWEVKIFTSIALANKQIIKIDLSLQDLESSLDPPFVYCCYCHYCLCWFLG